MSEQVFAYRTHLLVGIAACALGAVVACGATASDQPDARTAADTVFVGRFVTLDARQPSAGALAVKNGRIVAIGAADEVLGRVSGEPRRVDFPGVAIPGLADAHIHVLAFGEQLEMLDLRALQKDEILARVAAQAKQLPLGEWILGRGWDQGFWKPATFPTAVELDRVAPGHPVMLTRIDGHSVWLNSAAFGKAGITRDTPDPDGGRFLRGPDGAPAGMAVDNAVDLVMTVVPRATRAQNERRLRSALQQLVRWGVTSVHDAGVDLDTIGIYKELLSRGELPIRVYAMAHGTGPTAAHYLAAGPEVGLGDGRLTIRSFKVMLDGALGSRGALLSKPYADAPNERGLELMSDAALREVVAGAVAKGFQVNAHAIGDLAVSRALDAFERGGGPDVARRRFRVEHASVVTDADLPRFAKLGVLASMQPGFVGEYSRWSEDRVGSARVMQVLPTRNLLDRGAMVVAGTDYPAADSGNPLISLYSMVTRKGARGTPEGGWHADQRVDTMTALQAMTTAAAFAAFQEADLGALSVGRFADFTVLSADPLTTAPDQLRDLKAVTTVVAGAVVSSGS